MRGAVVLYGIIVILVCMQNWKEKASELGQWEIKGVQILYPILFITLLIPILFWNVENIRCFDDFTIADNSARYLLSALVQSLAAIIAIVVTMTLVAVQLTASAYSPRVIDIFKKDWVMWLLLVWYGLSIFFGLFVLEMIGGEYRNLGHWGVSLEFCVFLAYLMGIAAFVGLFWHIGNVINLLKPETIIKRLSENITKENVLKHTESVEENEKDRTKPIEEDPIQPIMDIIHSSIMKYDIATTRIGLKAVTNRVIEIIDSDSQEEISKCFCNHLERVGCRLGVSRADEESTVEVIENLYNFGKSTSEKKLEDAASITAASLGVVGNAAVEKKLEDAAKAAAESLGVVGKAFAEKRLGDASMRAARSLTSIGTYAIENELGDVARQVAKSLKNVGIAAVENKLGLVATKAVWTLEYVGKAFAEKRFGWVVWQAARSLAFVGISATENRLEEVAEQAAKVLADLTISSEEPVKTAIQRLEQEEQDRDALQKFMNLYEHELEELRTRNPN